MKQMAATPLVQTGLMKITLLMTDGSLVQRPLGHFLANHAARVDGAMAAGGAQAKRACAAIIDSRKIHIAKIEAARRG